MKAPLEGIRIIDWTIFQQGPLAAMMLADLGAEVIHVEHRVAGDPGRGVKKMIGQVFGVDAERPYYFETNNRGKKSITLDVKKPEGREIIFRLVEKSDVFIQNFRLDVASRLGLDYSALAKYNPKLVYAVGTGYGPKGPHAARGSLDILAEARAGMMFLAGERGGPPQYVVGGLADQMGAIMLAYGVLGALIARERQGVGQKVDASQLGSLMWLQGLAISGSLAMDGAQPRWSSVEVGNPLWNYYECKDRKWICLGMAQSDRFWNDFCRAVGLSHLISDSRFSDAEKREKNSRELLSTLQSLFRTKNREEWIAALDQPCGGLVSPVNDFESLRDDPQVLANKYIVDFQHPSYGRIKMLGLPVKFSVTPGKIDRPAPEFGQHTEEVLIDICGYSWEQVESLRKGEII